MAENFGVLLEAKLDEIKSGKTIEAQLKSMGQKIDSLPIGFNIDIPSVTKQFNGLVKVLESHIGQAGDALNEVFSTTRILKYKDTLGSTVKDYQKLNQETGKFETQNRTITEDAEKQKNILEEQSRIYQKIKSTLDSLPEQFKGTLATQDLYSMLDPNDNIDNLKALQNITDNYYKEVIALEKQYQSVKKTTNKDTIEAFKQEESKVDFIYQKRKQLLDLERQIATLSTTKGINTGNYTPEIENLRSVLGGLSTTGESLYNNQRNEINQIIDSLKQKLALEKDSLNIQKLQEEAQIKINNARQNLNDIITKNGKYDENQYEKLNNDLNTLENNLKSGAISTQDFNLEMKKLTPEMKQFETEARKASASTSTLSSRFKRFLSFYSFYDVLQLGKRLIREVATEIKALDDSILEVNKILNLSTDEMDKFVSKAYDMGEAISRTGRDMIDATGTMVKAGFSNLDEAMDFANLALSMKNVGDNMNDVERNANVLISTMKGFGDESVQFAEKTLNVLNEVSNTSAITFESLAESFTRTSAVYAQAGVSIEQLAGLATGANEIIQNIEKSSSGLLIISQRLRQVTAGFEEDPENLSKLDGALERIANIDIQDTEGQLRDTYSILTDIAEIYPTLTKNEQAYLGELIAGKRQISVFQALMANWGKVEKATNSAMNSAGSYTKEQENYFNSISGHLARLESSWQSLATKSLDADFTKSLIDAVTWIVKLTDACGGLQVVLGGLIASFISFKAVLSIDFLKNLVTQFSLLAKTTEVAGKAVTTLSLAGKLLIGASVVAGVMAIGYGINYLAGRANRAKEAVSTLSGELKDLESNSSNIESLGTQYLELKANKDNLNTEQLQEYYDTQNKLKELMPELNGFVNEQGNFIIENVDSLTDLTSVQREFIKLKREELALASKESMGNTVNSLENERKKLNYYESLRNSKVSLGRSDSEIENVDKKLKESADKVKQYFAEMSNSVLAYSVGTQNWAKLTEDEANAVRKAFADLSDEQKENFAKQIEDNTFNVQEFLNTLSEYPSYIEYMENATQNAITANNELASSFDSVEESVKKLSTTRSDIESLQKVFNSLSEGNTLSASDMEELLSISEEFIPYLNDEIALREKLGKTITDYKDTYQENYNKMLQSSTSYYDEKIRGDTELHKTLTSNLEKYFNNMGLAYEDNLDDYTTLENAKANISTQIIKQVAGNWSKYFSSTGDLIEELIPSMKGNKINSMVLGGRASEDMDKLFAQGLNYKESEIQRLIAESNKIADSIIFEPINLDFDTGKSSFASSADKAISEVDKFKEELERLKNEIDKILSDKEFEISLLEFSGEEDTTKQIAIYEQMQDEVHKLAQKYRAMGLSENDDYIQQLRTQWMDYAENISQLQSVAFDNSNKSIDRAITQLELQQQLFKDNSKEYLDIEQKKYDEIVKREQLLQTEIARLQAIGTNSAKEQAEQLIDTYYDTVSQRYSIIANLQSTQISIYKNQIDELNKQKDALSNLHKYTMQMIKDELNAKKKSIQDELKGIEAVFNAKKKALRDEKDSRSYEKGLTEKSSLVADLENQLALIKNDETAIAKRKKLEEELAKAKQDLTDYQYDHSIELQEDALDRELEKAKEIYDDKIDAIDKTLSNEVRLREMADKRIQQSGQKLYKQLIDYSKEYGSITEDEIKNAWDNANISLEGYKSTQESVLNKLKEITAELSKIEGLNTQDYSNKQGLDTLSYNAKLQQMQANSAKWTSSDDNERKRLAEENQKLGKALGLTYDSSTGVWYYDKQKKIRVYHSGGIVGGSGYATKDTEELAKLLKGELVITPPQAKTIMDNITNNNSETFSPNFIFQFDGTPTESMLKQFKDNAKQIANIVAEEMNKSRSNTGYKKKLKRA